MDCSFVSLLLHRRFVGSHAILSGPAGGVVSIIIIIMTISSLYRTPID